MTGTSSRGSTVWSQTRDNTGLTFVIAVNYGGRMRYAGQRPGLAKDCMAGKADPEHIDEAMFASYLTRPESRTRTCSSVPAGS